MKILPFAILLFSLPVLAQDDWPSHGGDSGGMKYSSLDDINVDTVNRLELAWTWETGDAPIPAAKTTFRGSDVRPGKFQGTPVMVDATLYIATSYTQVAALDPDTGKELWRYDPRAYEWGPLPRGCGFCHRGVAVWTDGEQVRVFINTRWRLIALDGRTGEPIGSFGHRGEVDLTEGLIWEVNKLHYTNTSPPMIYENLVIVGSGMPDNRVYRNNPPGDVQAFDVTTGERVWSFHTIPQRGEFGNDTWEDESWSYTGSTNVWAPFTIDAERGLVYLPVSTPNNDFYGASQRRQLVCGVHRLSRRQDGKTRVAFPNGAPRRVGLRSSGAAQSRDDRSRWKKDRRRRGRGENRVHLRLRSRHG